MTDAREVKSIWQRFGLWRCRVLGWHKAPVRPELAGGFQPAGTCPRCNRRVLLDSQGNWFAVRNILAEEDGR